MSSTYTPGFGSIIKRSTDGTTYAKIAQSMDLDGPETQTAKIKLTNNDSANNSQEYAPGLKDPQDFEFHVLYTPTENQLLETDRAARTILYWKEIFPDGSGYTFQGWVAKNKVTGKTENEALKADVTITPITEAAYVQTGLS